MSESDPREDSPHPPPLPKEVPPAIPFATPLDYGRPPAKRGVLPVPARVAIGCFGYVVLPFLWFAGATAVQSRAAGTNTPFWIGIGGWVAITIGLLGLTLYLRVRFGYKGYGYGILTAIGSVVLLVGGLILVIAATCGHMKF